MSFFEQQQIEEIFNTIKTSEKEGVDINEFYKGINELFPKYQRKTVDALFHFADKNKNNILELNEFISIIRFLERKEYKDDPYILLFEKYDTNKNHVLEFDEFKYICHCIDDEVDDDFISELFIQFDNDKNGVVDWDEYMEMCSQLQQQ